MATAPSWAAEMVVKEPLNWKGEELGYGKWKE